MNRNMIRKRLIAARALIDTPEKWTKGAYQRDAAGNEVVNFERGSWRSTATAPQFHCVSGAIMNVCHENREDVAIFLHLGKSIGLDCEPFYPPITSWNDAPERTHAEVMLAFDRAIEETAEVAA